MKLLIDSDTLCYAAAAVSEGQSAELARYNVIQSIESIFYQLNSEDYTLYLTGDKNYRYEVYPEYKANRKQARPQFLTDVRDYVQHNYNVILSDGIEADDEVSIDAKILSDYDTDFIVVHIDKDLDQIVGKHFNPKKVSEYIVSPLDAMRFFYYQMLVGDAADNVKGAMGIGPKKAEKILAGLTTEIDLYNAVKAHYGCEEELKMNADVLWIQKERGVLWSPPVEATEQ